MEPIEEEQNEVKVIIIDLEEGGCLENLSCRVILQTGG